MPALAGEIGCAAIPAIRIEHRDGRRQVNTMKNLERHLTDVLIAPPSRYSNTCHACPPPTCFGSGAGIAGGLGLSRITE